MTYGPLLCEADRLLHEIFPDAYLAETAVGERDEFLLRFVHPIPPEKLDAFVTALKGLRPPMATKNPPKSPPKSTPKSSPKPPPPAAKKKGGR